MKLLAFTDIHAEEEALKSIKQAVKENKPDLMLCTGDISIFGRGIHYVLNFLNRLKVKTLIIHGHHEDEKELKEAIVKYKNIIFLHDKTFEFEGITFYGYGGGGFKQRDKKFEKAITSKKLKGKPWILLVHPPVYKTKIDYLEWWPGHRGSKSIREAIIDFKPMIVFCGHFHETYCVIDQIGNTTIINPGPYGTTIELEKNKK